MKETDLFNFCNDGKKTKYSVDINRTSLPTYKMTVVGKKDAGKTQVYDLTVEKPYSNFVANNIISHNCNEPPKIPEHDEATWNRIRILDFESKFVKPQDIHKFPVPKSHEEQMKMKRFKADPYFMKKIPDIANVLLWKLFERFKIYKTKGLHEPKEVLLSTENYKSHNDIYLEFIKECIEKETDPKLVSKTSIRLVDVSSEFREWYRQNHPSYAKTNMIGRNMLKHELNKRLGLIKDPKTDLYGFGKQNRWWGYKIIQQEGDDNEGDNVKDLL